MEQEFEKLLARPAALPAHVPLAEAGTRQRQHLEQKDIIDRVKMAAHNVEEWLLELLELLEWLLQHYRNPHDVRALLPSFAHLSGEIRTCRIRKSGPSGRRSLILMDQATKPVAPVHGAQAAGVQTAG